MNKQEHIASSYHLIIGILSFSEHPFIQVLVESCLWIMIYNKPKWDTWDQTDRTLMPVT